MSRDSNYTYLHTHHSSHADLFEEFCHPPSSSSTTATNPSGGPAATESQIPGHFLAFEPIHLPAHLMPVNPEDEDDVVPDMHAAFGIQRALGEERGGRGVQQEPGWRDLGLERLLDGNNGNGNGGGNGGGVRQAAGASAGMSATGTGTGARREGTRVGVMLRR